MNWRKVLFIFFLAVSGAYFLYLEIFTDPDAPISNRDRESVQLMPLPAELIIHSGQLDVTSHLRIVLKGHLDPQVERSAAWFEERLKGITGFSLDDPTDVDQLIIICDTARMGFQRPIEDESYSLLVFSHGARLRAANPYGIIRGLETFLQLVQQREGKFYVPAVEIKDRPRFPWRGLMIDVARHWIPKDILLRNIEAMAAVKLNVLHLHLTDDQAWRVESKVFPKLHEMGSSGQYYTQQDILEIVDFAFERGIRVIPELDMPGHCTSWLIGYPELGAGPGPYALQTRFGSSDANLDPTNERVYQFIDQIVEEWAQLFPDPYFHIGGDEVDPTSWLENQKIAEFMQNKGYGPLQLHGYFANRVKVILLKHEKKLACWDELVGANLGTGALVQSWRGQESVFKAAQNGNYAILSGEYYLDRKLPASYHYGISPDIAPREADIEPDSIWKTWRLEIQYQGQTQHPELTFFGPPQSMRGILDWNGIIESFKEVRVSNNRVSFSLTSPLGGLDFDGQILGDSLRGEIKRPGTSKEVTGILTGSSDQQGAVAPYFSRTASLSETERANILGGEACMWTELVDARNLDSRIWPRLAAIAEKLWSPASLTEQLDDMYRRLEWVSTYLDYAGVNHNTAFPDLVRSLCPAEDPGPLRSFIDILEEAKFYDRMVLDSPLTVHMPLTRVVDVVRPESLPAVEFNLLVLGYLKYKDQARANRLRSILTSWSQLDRQLAGHFARCQKLEEVQELSKMLVRISELGLEALTSIESGETITTSELKTRLVEMDRAEEIRAGVVVAVVSPIRRLISASQSLPLK